jgi:hypothetical protein
MAKKDAQNQGEGNREAARRFNEQEEAFTKSGKGKQAIKKRATLSEAEAREAKKAEQEGS